MQEIKSIITLEYLYKPNINLKIEIPSTYSIQKTQDNFHQNKEEYTLMFIDEIKKIFPKDQKFSIKYFKIYIQDRKKFDKDKIVLFETSNECLTFYKIPHSHYEFFYANIMFDLLNFK